jgi:hypothetical protein
MKDATMTFSIPRSITILGCLAVSFLVSDVKPVSGQVYGTHPYAHTYHPEHGYVPLATGYGLGAYGTGAYGGGMTAAMGAGIGAGAAASGIGQMHEANAQAQISHQQAVNQYIQNRGLAQTTTIEMSQQREKAYQDRVAGEKAVEKHRIELYQKTMDQMAAAHRLTAEQFDFTRNVLHWPFVLRGPQYSDLRLQIDQLYDARTPDDSGKDSGGYDGIIKACDQMLGIVKAEVKTGLSVTDFVTAEHFISSIKYEAGFKVKPAK